jgi:hypothetical protein
MSHHAHEMVPKRCPNCETWMSEEGEYCPGCGQRFTTGKVTVKELLRDAFEAIFNFESRAYKTFFHLFVPGRLTNEYFKGRHRWYVTPLRLFLLTAILHFAVLAYIANELGGEAMRKIEMSQSQQAFHSRFNQEVDSLTQSLENNQFEGEPMVAAAFDSLLVELNYGENDSTKLGTLKAGNLSVGNFRVATIDIYTLTPEAFLDKYEVTGFYNRIFIRQELRMMTEVGSLVGYFLSKFTWMALLMMPALALILKLLYIRRKRFYVEHLIFSFHYHAFAFLLISLLGLIDLWLNTYGLLTGLGFLLVLIYLYLAMIKVYRQNWFKTFVKFNILNMFYTIIFSVFLTLTMLVSAFFY